MSDRKNPLIEAVVYDAVGTLIHVQPSVASVYAEIGKRFGSRLNADDVRHRFGPAFARQERLDREVGWRTGEARERQRWRQIVSDVLDDVADSDGCFEALFAHFSKPDAWRADPEAAVVQATLQTRGFRQAMASNFDQRLRGVIAGMPILPFLESIVISSEIGWRKPAPEFFTTLTTQLQLPAGAILFVGDDRGNDFDAARSAGMRVLLFDPSRRHLDAGPDRLERLGELLEWI